MPSPPTPFSLPARVALKIAGGELVVRHDGDVTIEQTLGRRLARIESGGDVVVRLGRITGQIRGAGRVTLEGPVDADLITGAEIHIHSATLRAKAIHATGRVTLHCATVQIDAIVADEVVFDPAASGHVRLLHGHLAQPPSRIQGLLSLRDFELRYGDPHVFLQQRGVSLPPQARGAPQVVSPPPSADGRPASPVDAAITRLRGAYGAQPPPRSVTRLLQAAALGADDLVRVLDGAWVDTLRHHAELGAAPPYAATLSFLALREATRA